MSTYCFDIREAIEKEINKVVNLKIRRPCIVKAKKSGPKEVREDRKAYFHLWFQSSKGVQQLLAVVEFEDGHVEQVQPTSVIFVDGGQFDSWEDTRNEEAEAFEIEGKDKGMLKKEKDF